MYNYWHEGKLLETETFIVFLRACLIVLLIYFFEKKILLEGSARWCMVLHDIEFSSICIG